MWNSGATNGNNRAQRRLCEPSVCDFFAVLHAETIRTAYVCKVGEMGERTLRVRCITRISVSLLPRCPVSRIPPLRLLRTCAHVSPNSREQRIARSLSCRASQSDRKASDRLEAKNGVSPCDRLHNETVVSGLRPTVLIYDCSKGHEQAFNSANLPV